MRMSLLLLPALFGLAGCFKDAVDAETSTTATGSSSEAGSTGEVTTSGGSTTTTTTTPPTTGPETSTGTDGSVSGTGEPTTGAACVSQTLPPVRPAVMLVVDRSGSMAIKTWDHDGAADTPAVTLWSSVHVALGTALAQLEPRVEFGLSTTPSSTATSNYSEEACRVSDPVDVPVGPLNADAILGELPPADVEKLSGADPTAKALRAALKELKNTGTTGPRQIVLISSGLPQCHVGARGTGLFEVYDDDAPAVAAEAFAEGIPVHVIGLVIEDFTTPVIKDGFPDSVNYLEKYTELAMAGGAPPFANATGEAMLTAALIGPIEAAADATDPCVVPLAIPATEPEQASVTLGGQPLLRVEDCAGESGWRFVGPLPHETIEVCGAACDAFVAAGAIEVEYCEAAPN